MGLDITAAWPRDRSWGFVALCVVGGGCVEAAILFGYASIVAKPPVALLFVLNSVWTLGVGLAVRAARTRRCPQCGATAHTGTFRIGRRSCDRCGAYIR